MGAEVGGHCRVSPITRTLAACSDGLRAHPRTPIPSHFALAPERTVAPVRPQNTRASCLHCSACCITFAADRFNLIEWVREGDTALGALTAEHTRFAVGDIVVGTPRVKAGREVRAADYEIGCVCVRLRDQHAPWKVQWLHLDAKRQYEPLLRTKLIAHRESHRARTAVAANGLFPIRTSCALTLCATVVTDKASCSRTPFPLPPRSTPPSLEARATDQNRPHRPLR